MSKTKLFTIGFTTKNSAENFFTTISKAGVKRLIDVRLNNVSQLAGFAKRDDLTYFLKVICDCNYRHEPLLAPTKEVMGGYKKKQVEWEKILRLCPAAFFWYRIVGNIDILPALLYHRVP